MNLILPNYPLVAGVISLDDINENFNAVQQHSLTDADVSASAALTVTKLAAYYVETFVHLIYHSIQAVWPAAGATTPLAAVPMPSQSGDDPWTLTDYSWVLNDTGTAAGSFGIVYGGYTGASNVWVTAGTVVASVSMTNGTNNAGNQGRSARLSTSIPNGASVTSIALISAAQGTVVLDPAATSFLTVSCRLRRKLMNF